MRIFRKAAVVTATAGLLAFGAVAGGGPALAGPGLVPHWVTGCENQVAAVRIGLQPNCTAAPGTVDNPTVIGIAVDTSALSALTQAQPGLGLDAWWTLSCVVDGKTVSVPGSYDITSTGQPSEDTIVLQTAVGSPEPNSCTVSNLMVQTSAALGDGAVELPPFSVGVAAEALTTVPGAIYQSEGTMGSGAHAMICADDTANGNAGSKIQAFQCLTDLAESFARTGPGQLVHNGDCLGLSGDKVVLAACVANETSQRWTQSTAGGTVKNLMTGTCLTAPSAKNGTQLTVASCGTGADQKWHIPAASVYTPCGVRFAMQPNFAMRAAC